MILTNSKIPKRHLALHNSGSARTIKEQVAAIQFIYDLLGKGMLVALIGGRGVGKTQIACEAALKNEQLGKTSLYSTAFELLVRIKSSYRSNSETEAEIIAEYCKPSLLIIDECHEQSGTDFENKIITFIIDKRYGAMKDTILISNASKRDFDLSMGDSIISRMQETGGIIECNWGSFRA